jgi:hypothetical protein
MLLELFAGISGRFFAQAGQQKAARRDVRAAQDDTCFRVLGAKAYL